MIRVITATKSKTLNFVLLDYFPILIQECLLTNNPTLQKKTVGALKKSWRINVGLLCF